MLNIDRNLDRGLKPHHFKELTDSHISLELIELNFYSISGPEAFDYKYQYVPQSKLRRNDGRLRDGYLASYRHDCGGWFFAGESGTAYKPDSPQVDGNGKAIKYVHQTGAPTGVYLLYTGEDVYWERIEGDVSIPIASTEGVKKTGCIQSIWGPTVGIPGIWNAYDRDGNLKEEILRFKGTKEKPRKIHVAFDQDTKESTRKTVKKALWKYCQKLEENGFDPHVVTWKNKDGRCKGADDLVSSEGPEALRDAFKKAIPWRKYFNFPLEPSKLTKVNKEINERFMTFSPEEVEEYKGKIVFVRGPMGTNKTGAAKSIVDDHDQTFSATYRKTLGEQQSNRLGIPYRDDILGGIEEGMTCGAVLCVDSMNPTSAIGWNSEQVINSAVDSLALVDEGLSVIRHILTSDTCKRNRYQTMKQITEASRQTTTVVVMDAHLDDDLVNFFEELTGKEIVVINNTYRSSEINYKSEFVTSEEELMIRIKGDMNGDKNIVILTGSQKVNSTYSAKNIERDLKRQYPEYKFLLVDSETIQDRELNVRYELNNLDNVLEKYRKEARPVCIVASPTLESGYSSTIKDFFHTIYYIGNGIHAPTSVAQALMRFRDCNVPRIIYVPETSNLGMLEGGYTTKNGVLDNIKKLKGASRSLHQEGMLSTGCESFYNSDNSELENDTDRRDYSFMPAWTNYYAQMVAKQNKAQKCYRESVRLQLEADGHTVNDSSLEGELWENEIEEIKEEMKDNKKAAVEESYDDTLNAPSISDGELESLDKQNGKTKKEQSKIKKGTIERSYGKENVTKELLIAIDNGLGNDIKHIELLNKPNFDTACLFDAKNPDIGTDANKILLRTFFLKKALNVEDVLGMDSIRNDDPFLIELNETAKGYRTDLRRLGVNIGKNNTPVKTVRTLLSFFGYKLHKDRCLRSNGGRVRIYSIVWKHEGVDREAILSYRRSRNQGKATPSLSKEEWKTSQGFIGELMKVIESLQERIKTLLSPSPLPLPSPS